MKVSVPAVTRTFVTSDGVRLAFDDTEGVGMPLVILHGWGQSRAMFGHQRVGLSGRRRVVTLDFRGHGESGKPKHGFRIARLAMDVYELLDHLDMSSVHLMGWSMGASVIWSFLDLFGSSRVASTVFVDQPSTVVQTPWASAEEAARSGAILKPHQVIALAHQIRDDTTGRVVEEFVRGMFSREPRPEVWNLVQDEIRLPRREQAAALLLDHAFQDWRDLLPRVSTPALVIGCEGSHVSPLSQRFVAASIPRAEVHIITEDRASSHFPFLENPDAFNVVVEDFLARQGVPAGRGG